MTAPWYEPLLIIGATYTVFVILFAFATFPHEIVFVWTAINKKGLWYYIWHYLIMGKLIEIFIDYTDRLIVMLWKGFIHILIGESDEKVNDDRTGCRLDGN